MILYWTVFAYKQSITGVVTNDIDRAKLKLTTISRHNHGHQLRRIRHEKKYIDFYCLDFRMTPWPMYGQLLEMKNDQIKTKTRFFLDPTFLVVCYEQIARHVKEGLPPHHLQSQHGMKFEASWAFLPGTGVTKIWKLAQCKQKVPIIVWT